MAESKEELKSLLTKEGSKKAGLKLNIQKTKIMAFSPITSCKYMGKQWKQWETIFLGSKITADGDCNYEIKRCLLLERKAMTKLYSRLKSKDITLQTKFWLVKIMVFPVVMYECESWNIKKVEWWKKWYFWTVVLEKTLESPLDCKEIQPVHPKGDQSWVFIGGTDVEAETLILWAPQAKN